MEGEAHRNEAFGEEPVGDLNAALGAIEGDGPLMHRLAVLAGITGMTGAPAGDRALLKPGRGQQAGLGRIEPEEGAAEARLVETTDLEGVVAEGRAEVAPKIALGQVAIGTGVGQDIDSAMTQLEREGIGMGMGGDG